MSDKLFTAFGGTLLLAIGPLLFTYFAKNAFDGLFRGRAFTQFGIRFGWLARFYGIFYALLFLICAGGYILIAPSYLNLGFSFIIAALLLPLPANNASSVGLIFIGIGLFTAILIWLLSKYVARRYPTPAEDGRQARARKIYLYDYFISFELSGLILLMNAPIGLLVLVLAASAYIFPILGVKPEDAYSSTSLKSTLN